MVVSSEGWSAVPTTSARVTDGGDSWSTCDRNDTGAWSAIEAATGPRS